MTRNDKQPISISETPADFKEIEADQEWEGFIRKDFQHWNHNHVKIGCILRFPFKFMIVLFYIGGLTLLILFSLKFKDLG